MRKLKIATVFSGIGAFEQALEKTGINYDIVFACDNGERELKYDYKEIKEYCDKNHFSDEDINKYIKELYSKTNKENMMKKSYFENYQIDEKNWYEDIRFINGSKYHNQVDILAGGSPCQSFSLIGKRAGLNDVRGTLFYDYARLVNEIQPKVFIYENVPGMLVHDGGNTWKVIREVFESLNYKLCYKVLNAKDYGIPQNRRRLFVVGIKDINADFEFPQEIELTTTMFDYLEDEVDARYYLGRKGFLFVTNPKYSGRARVNKDIIQTQKANQQFNWNGDFVFEELSNKHTEEILARAYVGEFEGKRGVIRQLSHRECLRLMGFPDTYRIVVSNVWAYRQAGNSIVVDVLAAIIEEVLRYVKF